MSPRIGLLAGLVAALVTAASAAAAPEPPLSHEGRWLTDAQNRVVILHGLNMVSKVGSLRPEDTGFGADDARFLARNGFNTIRLGIIYRGLEPHPPGADGKHRYRRGYLRSIERTERTLAERRIFSLIDFHQDLYNERFQGEGWPDWQVIDDGLPSEPQQGFPTNYLVNVGLNRAFDNFWANAPAAGIGLQDSYAAAWRRTALMFRREPYVVGYDLLNEPWPGSAFYSDACADPAGCLTFDTERLTPFSDKVIAAIRSVDPDTLAFYEPAVTFNFGADSKHGDTGDANAGFSFHNYCLPAAFGGAATADVCEPLESSVFDNADKQTAETGDVPFLTEFGATDDLDTIERIIRLADRHMVSWQYWHYCACDDPTTQGPGVQALVIDASKPPRGENLKAEKLRVLARPYPRAVAGTPTSYAFDPAIRQFTLAYSTAAPSGGKLARSVLTEVFVPKIQYPHGYRAQVAGAKVVSKRDARVLRLERSRASAQVSLTLAPR